MSTDINSHLNRRTAEISENTAQCQLFEGESSGEPSASPSETRDDCDQKEEESLEDIFFRFPASKILEAFDTIKMLLIASSNTSNGAENEEDEVNNQQGD